MAFSVLLDTCTLHKPYLRDTLLRLADAEIYRPLWSAAILDELRHSLIRRGFAEDRIDYLLDTMTSAFEDAEVTGYEDLVGSMQTSDPDDRHVLAAAVRSEAAVIVTDNVSDFPEAATTPYEIEVKTPDEFLLDQLDLHRDTVLLTLTDQADAHRRPPHDLAGLLTRLERDGLSAFPQAVREYVAMLG